MGRFSSRRWLQTIGAATVPVLLAGMLVSAPPAAASVDCGTTDDPTAQEVGTGTTCIWQFSNPRPGSAYALALPEGLPTTTDGVTPNEFTIRLAGGGGGGGGGFSGSPADGKGYGQGGRASGTGVRTRPIITTGGFLTIQVGRGGSGGGLYTDGAPGEYTEVSRSGGWFEQVPAGLPGARGETNDYTLSQSTGETNTGISAFIDSRGGGGNGGSPGGVGSAGTAGGVEIQFTGLTVPAPGAPTITAITPGNGQLSVNFTAASGTVTTYQYSLDGGAWTTRSSGTTASPLVITGLVNGTTYSVQIRALNGRAEGTASGAETGAPRTTPGAPTGVSAAAGNAQAVVSWTAPASDGGSAITSYTATSSPGGLSCTTASTSCTVTGLANGTAYTFTVVADNVVGPSSASAASTAVTPTASGGGGGGGGSSTPEPTPTVTPTATAPQTPSTSGSTSTSSAPTSPLIPTGEPTTPPSIPPITWPGTSSGEPSFDPGVAGCICAGDPNPVAVDDEDGDVQVSANGTTTTLEPKSSSGAPASGAGGSGAVVVPGGTTTVGGSGYQPGSVVTVYAQPGSIPLGTLTVGPNGAVTGSVFIPPTLPKSGVTLQIDGVPFGGGPSSGPISVAVGVATGPPTAGTGGSSGSAGTTGKGASGVPATPNLGASGKPPVVKPGAGKVTPASGGKKPKVDPTGVSVELPDGGSLQATPAGPTGIKNKKPGSGSTGGKKTAPKVQPGGFVEVKGKGLEPGTSANVWFDPAGPKPPVYGGSTQASSNGEVKGWVNVPKGLPKGNTTMQIDVVTKGKPGKPGTPGKPAKPAKPGKGVTISAGVEVESSPPVVGGKPAAPITPKSSTWPGGGSSGPSLPAGSSSAVCAGCAANPPVTESPAGAPKSKTLEVGDTTIGLGSSGAGGASNPQSGGTPLVVTPGGFTTVSGSGFKPGTTVSVFVNPGKVLLGTVTVGPGGTITGSLPVPATIPKNATIQLDGVTKGGAGQSVATGSTTTPPVTPAGPLAGLGEGPGAQPTAPMAGSDGAAPEVKPGKTAILPAVPAVASPTVSGGTISTGLPTGGTVSVTPVNDKGNPVGGSSAAAVKPVSGGLVGVQGSGYAPGTTVQVWFLPGPIFGGSVTVGQDGTVEGWAQVPEGTKPGNYTMQLSGVGVTPSGTKAPVAWSQGITVQPGKGSGTSGTSIASGSGGASGPTLLPTVQPLGTPTGGLPQQEPGTTSAVVGPAIQGGVSGGGVGGSASTGGTASGSTTPATTSVSPSGGGTSVTVTTSGGGIQTPPITEVGGQSATGGSQPVGAGNVVSAPQGGFIGTASTGFAPGTPVTVFLLPSLTPVGTGTVGPKGSVGVVSPVPTSLPPGNGTLQVVGTTPKGQPVAMNLGVTITPAPAPAGPATSPLAGVPTPVGGKGGAKISVTPGDLTVLVEGVPAQYSAQKASGSTKITTPTSSVEIKTDSDSSGALTLRGGSLVEVTGTGAKPGSVMEVWSTSGERLLGRIMVGADGSYSGWIFIPTTLPQTAGAIQVNGILADGRSQSVSLAARYLTLNEAQQGSITNQRAVTYFAYQSPKLSKQGKQTLREFASLFPTNAYSVTTIVGVIRASGARSSDRTLALRRALNTKRFLEQQGIQGIIRITSGTTTDTTARARRVISVISSS